MATRQGRLLVLQGAIGVGAWADGRVAAAEDVRHDTVWIVEESAGSDWLAAHEAQLFLADVDADAVRLQQVDMHLHALRLGEIAQHLRVSSCDRTLAQHGYEELLHIADLSGRGQQLEGFGGIDALMMLSQDIQRGVGVHWRTALGGQINLQQGEIHARVCRVVLRAVLLGLGGVLQPDGIQLQGLLVAAEAAKKHSPLLEETVDGDEMSHHRLRLVILRRVQEVQQLSSLGTLLTEARLEDAVQIRQQQLVVEFRPILAPGPDDMFEVRHDEHGRHGLEVRDNAVPGELVRELSVVIREDDEALLGLRLQDPAREVQDQIHELRAQLLQVLDRRPRPLQRRRAPAGVELQQLEGVSVHAAIAVEEHELGQLVGRLEELFRLLHIAVVGLQAEQRPDHGLVVLQIAAQ
eukprot:m.239226 g.239226  ORF g.239226 m.239226 type:complete len:408 (+) comp13451_c0_seq1:103-1326(+)